MARAGSPPDRRVVVVARTIPAGQTLFRLEFPTRQFKSVCLTAGEHWIVGLGFEAERETLYVHHTESGEFLHKIPLKYPRIKAVLSMAAVPDRPAVVALFDADKANLVDLKNRKFWRSLPQWNGAVTR